MDNRGQISAEYLLLIVVILIVLTSVTLPLVGTAINNSNDISWSSDAKIAVQTIANAVNIVYANGPGSKQTNDVYIPQTMALTNAGNSVVLTVTLSDGSTKTITGNTGYALSATNIPLSRGWHTIQVYWPQGTNAITITAIS
ncbi:MAG: class III signal peptide-containing protein [Methanobacterium sp.]|uniref:class III signal peptide-containing protein n=1 Tax=Methanobacterium sp. TaxID=2164 RepID=UPI003D657AB0|nr:class III signal peptide-containing protein [Methanobacterium sp.]